MEADLPYSTGETTLQKEFSDFGKIAEGKCTSFLIIHNGMSLGMVYIMIFSTLTHTSWVMHFMFAVKMVKDMKTKRSKGIAFIQYTCQDDAMLALETMDQKVQIFITCLTFFCQ